MKTKIMALAVLLFSGLTTLTAQEHRQGKANPEDKAKRTVARLKEGLELTEQQEKDITPIYTAFFTDMEKLREKDEKASPKDARKALVDEKDAKLEKILNPEQLKKLKEMEAQRMADRPRAKTGE